MTNGQNPFNKCLFDWIEKNESAYEYWRNKAHELDDASELTVAFQKWVHDQNPLLKEGDSLQSELLMLAIDSINFAEIADNWLGEISIRDDLEG